MSETPLPPGLVPPGLTPRNATPPAAEPNARLVRIPDEVVEDARAARQPIKLRGEVIQSNTDGSVRVRTPQGDVDIKLRPDQPIPAEGQEVEIEIPPARTGRPPETATVREVKPETPAPPRSDSTPVEVREAPPPRETPPPRPLQTDPEVAERRQPLPAEGSIVRLQPLPPRTEMPAPPPEILPQVISTLTAPIIYEAQIIAQNIVQTQNIALNESLPLQTPTPPPQTQTPLLQLVTIPPATAQPAPEQTSVVIAPPQAKTVIAPPPLPVLSATPAALPAIIPPTPVPITDTAAPLPPAFDSPPALAIPQGGDIISIPAQPAPILLKPQTQNVQIEKILPPEVSFTAPAPDGKPAPVKTETPQTPAILTPNKAGSVTGIVTGITPQRLPVLNVFFPQWGTAQNFALQFPAENIAIGTQIQITPQIPTAVPTATHPAESFAMPPLPLLFTPQPWPAMDDILQTLARTAPSAAQTMINITPSPANPAQLAPAILFFIAAVRGGDLSQWLGEKTAEILRATQRGSNALSRLLGEGSTLSRIANDSGGPNWNTVNVPLYWNGDMQRFALFYKNEHQDRDDPRSGLKSTRFVFDLALENMGKVQLDGLFRPIAEGGKRLDLVVRTEQHFSQATQAEMRRVYARALRDTQVTGELSFQNAPESWVTVQANNDKVLGVNA